MAETEESPKEALQWLEIALKTTPDSFIARMHQARALALLERNAEAKETLDAATRLNPGHPYGWYLRGALRGRSGDMEGAYADFKESTRRAPLDISGWFNLGASARNTGRFREAIEAFEKALTLSPPNRAEIEQLIAQTKAQATR
jgi:tetratricopeptide (TPR) repeat protein